jgi:hypothetical protein
MVVATFDHARTAARWRALSSRSSVGRQGHGPAVTGATEPGRTPVARELASPRRRTRDGSGHHEREGARDEQAHETESVAGRASRTATPAAIVGEPTVGRSHGGPGIQSKPVAVRPTRDSRSFCHRCMPPDAGPARRRPGATYGSRPSTSDTNEGWTGESSASITLANGRMCISPCHRRRRGAGGRGGRRDDERAVAAKSQHRTCDQTEHAERQDGRHQGLTSPAADPPHVVVQCG